MRRMVECKREFKASQVFNMYILQNSKPKDIGQKCQVEKSKFNIHLILKFLRHCQIGTRKEKRVMQENKPTSNEELSDTASRNR